MKKINAKTFVIIGASGSIGSELARGLHKMGANVVLVARSHSKDKIFRLRDEFGAPDRVLPYICDDVTNQREVNDLLTTVETHFGSPYTLITSVGKWVQVDVNSPSKTFIEQLDEDLDSFVKSVSIPIFIANQFFLKNGGGLIVDISSHVAESLLPGNLTYAQAKAAVKAFLENLRAENGPKSKSKITRIVAQLVDTPANRLAFPKITEKEWRKTVQIEDMAKWIARQVTNERVPSSKFFKSGIVV